MKTGRGTLPFCFGGMFKTHLLPAQIQLDLIISTAMNRTTGTRGQQWRLSEHFFYLMLYNNCRISSSVGGA